MIATREPTGGGCASRARATSIISRPDRARITPACSNAARQIRSLPASEAVCEAAARAPATERPVLATMTGACGVTRAAESKNARPCARDSRKKQRVRLAGSAPR